jgi:hypothetical protein
LITPQVLDRVADAWLHEGRRLAVIAVDMDCGKPELLDLTAVALQRDRPDRAARYVDYLMASSASPVAFPPVFIDGRMMVDGALRQHIPFPSQIKQLLAGREQPGQGVNLFMIVNSPRLAIPQCITDHVLLVALRTGDVWTGERANDSLALAMTDAARRGWTARYVAPDDDQCQPVPPPADETRAPDARVRTRAAAAPAPPAGRGTATACPTPLPASSRQVARASSAPRVLFRTAAGTPFSRAPSTWSFINEINGLTTTVKPSRRRAGSW